MLISLQIKNTTILILDGARISPNIITITLFINASEAGDKS
jgi:hypothetical protein